ncbi:hypothetical protein HY500_01395 [Candidatus Woesearchaeota archaeon]|nr:hypothetical protein [Candidatus Woesearchaeota archaeon]
MKKESALLILFFLIFISGCARPELVDFDSAGEEPREIETQELIESKFTEETPETVEEEGIQEDIDNVMEEETAVAVPEQVAGENFEIFEPVLTYPGAYNGPLYGTSEQVGPVSMDSYFENLDRNGINFFIGMFGISDSPTIDTLISDQGLGEVIDAAQKHPYRIIPFFNPGIGGEEVEQYLGDELTEMYSNTLSASKNVAGEDFIRGLGEVETQEWSVRHNDGKVIELIELAKTNNINFMFHPVASKIDDVEKIVESYPDTVFLIHMYREDLTKSRAKLIKILEEHDNLYFSMDAAHILHVDERDIIYDYDSSNKILSINKFVSTYNNKEKSIIDNAVNAYKPIVDAVPDKVMWGTEIGPEYAFDPEVFDRAVKISRFVIAGFELEDQEAVGYKNALRVFGEGVKADSTIEVRDTSLWPECSESQMNNCDDSCDTPDSDFLTPEQDACFLSCLNNIKCKEVVEQDIG